MDSKTPLAFVIVVCIVLLGVLMVGIVVKIGWSFCLDDRVVVDSFERKRKRKEKENRLT